MPVEEVGAGQDGQLAFGHVLPGAQVHGFQVVMERETLHENFGGDDVLTLIASEGGAMAGGQVNATVFLRVLLLLQNIPAQVRVTLTEGAVTERLYLAEEVVPREPRKGAGIDLGTVEGLLVDQRALGGEDVGSGLIAEGLQESL